jgi:4-hydroxy-tetrahydrodipicolinate synthase
MDLGYRVVVGVAASSADEAIRQVHQAGIFGCRTLLLAPPYYFKDVGDAGLELWFSAVLDAIRRDGQRAILYHIPAVTMVPLSQALIEGLKRRFPGTVYGVKDSSGDWGYTSELLARHRELAILIGDERRLAEAVRMGAQGAISGLANFVAELLLPLVDAGKDDSRVSQIVDELLKYPVIPGVKELTAHVTGDRCWRAVAPPLEALVADAAARLTRAFDSITARVPA